MPSHPLAPLKPLPRPSLPAWPGLTALERPCERRACVCHTARSTALRLWQWARSASQGRRSPCGKEGQTSGRGSGQAAAAAAEKEHRAGLANRQPASGRGCYNTKERSNLSAPCKAPQGGGCLAAAALHAKNMQCTPSPARSCLAVGRKLGAVGAVMPYMLSSTVRL